MAGKKNSVLVKQWQGFLRCEIYCRRVKTCGSGIGEKWFLRMEEPKEVVLGLTIWKNGRSVWGRAHLRLPQRGWTQRGLRVHEMMKNSNHACAHRAELIISGWGSPWSLGGPCLGPPLSVHGLAGRGPGCSWRCRSLRRRPRRPHSRRKTLQTVGVSHKYSSLETEAQLCFIVFIHSDIIMNFYKWT